MRDPLSRPHLRVGVCPPPPPWPTDTRFLWGGPQAFPQQRPNQRRASLLSTVLPMKNNLMCRLRKTWSTRWIFFSLHFSALILLFMSFIKIPFSNFLSPGVWMFAWSRYISLHMNHEMYLKINVLIKIDISEPTAEGSCFFSKITLSISLGVQYKRSFHSTLILI